MSLGAGGVQVLTLFELYSHPCIVLDFLNHLPTASDDDADRVPGNRHLEGRGG